MTAEVFNTTPNSCPPFEKLSNTILEKKLLSFHVTISNHSPKTLHQNLPSKPERDMLQTHKNISSAIDGSVCLLVLTKFFDQRTKNGRVVRATTPSHKSTYMYDVEHAPLNFPYLKVRWLKKDANKMYQLQKRLWVWIAQTSMLS